MKKSLLFAMLALAGISVSAQFTKNRVVVSQYGDGVNNYSNTRTSHVFLKEFKTALETEGVENSPTYTLSMPTAPRDPANGINNLPVTGLRGTSPSYEGLLTLSGNGQYITALGFGVVPNTLVAQTDLRVLVTIDANGVVNSITDVKGSANNLNNPRCAVTLDGTQFWAVGDGGGLRYRTSGYLNGDGTTSSVTSTPSPFRSISIFNNKLYGATNSATGPRIFTVSKSGNYLTTASSSVSTALPGFETASVPNQVVFFSIAGGDPDLLYLASDGTGEIEKWLLNTTTATWEKKGTITVTGDAPKGITGQIDIGLKKAYVYVTSNSKLYRIEDIDIQNSSLSTVGNPLTTLATAPANTMFRGVSLTPTSNPVLPVKLTSFNGKQTNQGVKLDWTTSSETNNAYFELLKSDDGKSFKSLVKIKGNHNSSVTNNYSHTDKNPINGNNYYQLKQVDLNGDSETFKTIVVSASLNLDKASAYISNGKIEAQLVTEKAGKANLMLASIDGRKIINSTPQVTKGQNTFSLSSPALTSGIYILTIAFDGKTHRIKLIK